jgi:hypothetical protein
LLVGRPFEWNMNPGGEEKITPVSPLRFDSYTPPKCYILACNPKKSTCLGPIIRCASALGVHQIILVGYAKCYTSGAHGADKHVSILSFPTMEKAVEYVKSSSDANCEEIIGILNGLPYYHDGRCTTDTLNHRNCELPVVIDNDRNCIGLISQDRSNNQPKPSSIVLDPLARISYACHSHKFSLERNTCFFVSLSPRHELPLPFGNFCDSFLHVPHCFLSSEPELDISTSLSPSLLNVETCLSIVLHHFATFVQYDERNFQGHKFKVNSKNIYWKGAAMPSSSSPANEFDRMKEGEDDTKLGLALIPDQGQETPSCRELD